MKSPVYLGVMGITNLFLTAYRDGPDHICREAMVCFSL